VIAVLRAWLDAIVTALATASCADGLTPVGHLCTDPPLEATLVRDGLAAIERFLQDAAARSEEGNHD
jgi:hypothetical protein